MIQESVVQGKEGFAMQDVYDSVRGNRMSEEQRFRLSLGISTIVQLAVFIGGAIGLWTTMVQKYDQVEAELGGVGITLKSISQTHQDEISKIDATASAIAILNQRVDAQSSRLVNDETRELQQESKIDALTSLLNQFISTRNMQQGSELRSKHSP